ncbi:hypothetical protein EKO27_g10612 [Xylaria grammica]|uniref:Major facilitator superfamily (MFS) profile domain-containing protein n=1 Tax=Xylaria grammica TaxID=363999 RepID=A0A439CQW4_9PEZI|nr:hypothetical protein EKO27_g10612 [Xylaria grammica]
MDANDISKSASPDGSRSTSRQEDAKELYLNNTDPAVSTVDEDVPYTVFTKWEKRSINLQSSFAAMFSTLSSYIYFPALVPMAKDLHVSVALINLTVTSYLIIAAVAPAFMGDLADQGGRRPVYILMFFLMLGANVVMYAITYAVKLTLQTSLGAQALQIYQLNYLDGGLVYLPSGVAGGIGSYMTDRNYRKAKSRLSSDMNVDSSNHLNNESLIKLRLTGMYLLVIVTAAGTVGYGWALATKAHISVMLILQFLTGMTTASTFTMTSTLLTDLNADRSATAQGASSIVRGLLAAAATASVEPLAESVGLGWCFVVYAVVVLINLPLSWGLQYYGNRL